MEKPLGIKVIDTSGDDYIVSADDLVRILNIGKRKAYDLINEGIKNNIIIKIANNKYKIIDKDFLIFKIL